jgi:hypothetical protein
MELDGLIDVRQRALLQESGSKAGGKVAEKHGSTRMAKGTERECSSMELSGLIQVR